MYDRKVVRRRRAALAVFVVLSIAILTAYFGESGGGFFHTLQRGAQEAVAPIETGASRALKPVRDFFGWAGDTIDAKDQNADLKKEVQRLRGDLAEAETERRDAGQLEALASLHEENYFPQSTAPVNARVIAKSATIWYSTVKIDKGSDDGVRENQPVIAAGGLIGKVTTVTGGTAEVRLITDGQSGVSAQVFPEGVTGVVRPEVGNPEDLLRHVAMHRPTVAIVDIRMPPTNTDEGLRAAREIRARFPGTGVLVLSQYVEAAYAMDLFSETTEGLG